MGRSRTPTLIVREQGNFRQIGAPEWRVRSRGPFQGMGRPTRANLARFIQAGNRTFQENGVNWHITEGMRTNGSLGPNEYPEVLSAQIVRNDGSGEVVASWSAPRGAGGGDQAS